MYPADEGGCGQYRMIMVSEILRQQGHDVRLIPPSARDGIGGDIDTRTGKLVGAKVPPDADVIVMQRVSMSHLVEAIPFIRARGVAVVVDMDDDLTRIDPSNPAFYAMHPRTGHPMHTWRNAHQACLNATLVTVSTPALLEVYAPHGRGVVLPNRVPSRYLGIPHPDSPVIGWPGSVHSHPLDLQEVGPAVARLLREGRTYRGVGPAKGLREGLGLEVDPDTSGAVDIEDYPYELTTIGVGLAPLADTRFNAAKSWLKPLELSALGVPWVASPRVEYRRFHEAHKVGLLAERPKDWYQQVKKLTGNEALRVEQSAAGRAAAAANTLEAHAWRWWEAWSAASLTQRKATGKVLTRV